MFQNSSSEVNVLPMDEHNQKLVNYVHPADWLNPQPQDCYDLVVIGAGTAGLVVAAGAAGLDIGLKVALVEKHLMGGDCLNFGCIPSKCLIRSSRIIGEIEKAKKLGINIGDTRVDFAGVMTRMRQIRADISPHDSVQRFQKLGIDVFLGSARFLGQNAVAVAGKTLAYKKAVIATGARAFHPDIPGLKEAGFYTNETIFSLTELPPRLAVIGGGPLGCELAQAFQRLGAQVILFHNHSHLLNKEDQEAAEIIENTLLREGMQLILSCQIERVTKNEQGKTIEYTSNGQGATIPVDEILVAAGREPNVSGLNLEAVAVEYDTRRGVKVNDYLQTTNPKIYAAGDICMDWKFTHAADAAARIVIKNTLFSPFGFGRNKLSNLVMPWVTYTNPEIARVGMDEKQAQTRGLATNTIKIPLSIVDRAITDGETAGFFKIIHKQGSDQILGATIVASHAGEMISEITTAMVAKIGLSKLSTVIHPYPTQAEAIKKAADAYRRTLLTPNSKKLLELLTKLSG
ncbi:mercuric reductase [Microcystis aeruginosa]|uniref:FAD-containing oxidoreductase n=1 Tax=Microcystis aeruginosa FD4 TaxID=2686288 RepID=A0A857CYU2_MICAE|nr:mercuric reductase [Microcystis aeruginosa]QGZ88591.1 FAD-containing oxidoreductase [Microcystis aeruginosa FD4]